MSVSLDTDREKLEEFIKERDLSWHFGWSGEAWNDPNAKLYSVNSIPSIWLINKMGILRHFNVRGEELAAAVGMLLKE